MDRDRNRDRDRDRLSRWEDNVAHVTLGTDHNAPLDHDTGLEHHHLNIITLGDNGDQLYINK